MIPFVTIQLDKVYNLRFGMGAQVEFEQLTGMKLGALGKELEKDPSMDIISKVLWVMMKRENKELTINQVYEIVDENADNLTEIVNAVTKAINAAWEVKNRPNAQAPKK